MTVQNRLYTCLVQINRTEIGTPTYYSGSSTPRIPTRIGQHFVVATMVNEPGWIGFNELSRVQYQVGSQKGWLVVLEATATTAGIKYPVGYGYISVD